jgi:hypothetical protein
MMMKAGYSWMKYVMLPSILVDPALRIGLLRSMVRQVMLVPDLSTTDRITGRNFPSTNSFGGSFLIGKGSVIHGKTFCCWEEESFDVFVGTTKL